MAGVAEERGRAAPATAGDVEDAGDKTQRRRRSSDSDATATDVDPLDEQPPADVTDRSGKRKGKEEYLYSAFLHFA